MKVFLVLLPLSYGIIVLDKYFANKFSLLYSIFLKHLFL